MSRAQAGSDTPGLSGSLVAVKPLGTKTLILVLVFGCFGTLFGQSWPKDTFKRVTFEKWCRTHSKLTP